MKVVFQKNEKNVIAIWVPNWIFLNKLCFGIIKSVILFKFKPIRKLKYKAVKKLVKLIRGYKGLELVSVLTADGSNIKIFL